MSVTASGTAPQQRSSSRWQWRSFAIRVGLTVLALVIWFWTQSLIGGRGGSNLAIGDSIHQLTAPLNRYLHLHASTANALLIVSSVIIDLLGVLLLARWLFGGSLRPFLALIIVL